MFARGMKVEEIAHSHSSSSPELNLLQSQLERERRTTENLRKELERVKGERERYRNEIENANQRALDINSQLLKEKIAKGRLQSQLDDLKVLTFTKANDNPSPPVKPKERGVMIIESSSSPSRIRKRRTSDDFRISDPQSINTNAGLRKRPRISSPVLEDSKDSLASYLTATAASTSSTQLIETGDQDVAMHDAPQSHATSSSLPPSPNSLAPPFTHLLQLR
ncbi:hypothetical protein BT96DRAFT_989813 [Gymnopus androsaceus JB14]|uniref:Uncharacterized protein n=1 Tax=Gymnopus androsaceus JB14 TaxID=1447944 RepID=A0A6A4I1G8_9AGAR|nr:hypothetical protein BT96DRAFT_989813 [Gymnopus androsaceus JB14]